MKKRTDSKERWVADLDSEYKQPRDGWEYRGVKPYKGRFWAYSKSNMREFAEQGRLRHTFKGMPEYKRYLDEMPGVPLQDVWVDVPPIASGTAERLGYPTQKPEALLERIIKVSSDEGDVVLDPFCGCGTAIAVAHKLKRRWIGIDITHLATNLIKSRLAASFTVDGGVGTGRGRRLAAGDGYEVIGEPTTQQGATQLAKNDPFQFQAWALGLVNARVASSAKKGADRGIDGKLFFSDDEKKSAKVKSVLFSVKAGKVGVAMVRDLVGVLERESDKGAVIGVLISLNEPTEPMRREAASAGFYDSPWGTRHPRVQLLTVDELLEDARVDLPATGDVRTFKAAPRSKRAAAQNNFEFDA